MGRLWRRSVGLSRQRPVGLTNPQTWNRYAYVAGDPVNYVDPTGLYQAPPEPETMSFSEGYWYFYAAWSNVVADYAESAFLVMGDVWGIAFVPGFVGAGGGGLDPTTRARMMLAAARARAHQALMKEDCAKLFGSYRPNSRAGRGQEITALDVLHGLRTGKPGRFGLIEFRHIGPTGDDPTPAPAFTQLMNPVMGTLRRAVGATRKVKITINTYSGGTYWNDSVYNATELLLHELGHALRFIGFRGGEFVQDDGSRAIGRRNSELIREHCL